MNTLTNSTRTRTVGSTTAFSSAGTAFGGALALLLNELFNLPLSDSGVLALGVVFSTIGAALGGWLAPNKRAEVESYLGSVLAMAKAGDHGQLSTTTTTSTAPASVVEPAPVATSVVSSPADVVEQRETVEIVEVPEGTDPTAPAYAGQ